MSKAYGKYTLNDVYDLYQKLPGDRYEAMDVQPIGKIYAKDYVAQSESSLQHNGGLGMVNNLTIITNTRLHIEVGYYVKNRKTGDVWKIQAIPSIDDDNESKKYSLRPALWTILELVK